MTTTTTEIVPSNARAWLYTSLHQLMSQLQDVDLQLGLEMALDQICARRNIPNKLLKYDVSSVLENWQDSARNGCTLYDVLKGWAPPLEREMFHKMSSETFHTCFANALTAVRADLLSFEEPPVEQSAPAWVPVASKPMWWKHFSIGYILPFVAAVSSFGLGVWFGKVVLGT